MFGVYKLINHDRQLNRGIGVILYVRKKIEASVLSANIIGFTDNFDRLDKNTKYIVFLIWELYIALLFKTKKKHFAVI